MPTGADYEEVIAKHIVECFSSRGIEVFLDVQFGRTILGKSRKIDLLLLERDTGKHLALECKYQGVSGSTEEKLPYALENIRALPFPGYLVYSGEGFSENVLHFLASTPNALLCTPPNTKLLDQTLAECFGWWDIILQGREPFTFYNTVNTKDV